MNAKYEKAKARREWYKAHGICVDCTVNNAEPGRVRCTECRERLNAYQRKRLAEHPNIRKRYNEAQAARYWADPEKYRARERERARGRVKTDKERAQSLKYARAAYNWYRENGVCPRCRKRSADEGHAYCPECRADIREYNRAREERKHERQASERTDS